MKKILYTILMVSALFFAACSSPTSSSGSDSGSGSGGQTNQSNQSNQSNQGNQTTYPKLLLKDGSHIHEILKNLNYSTDAVAFQPSATAPDESKTVKYLDLLEEDVPIWYDTSTKTFYFYAEEVTTEGATKKVKLNKDSRWAFKSFPKLETLNLSCFDSSEVESFDNTFAYCESLKTLNISNFSTTKVKSMMGMFDGCKAL